MVIIVALIQSSMQANSNVVEAKIATRKEVRLKLASLLALRVHPTRTVIVNSTAVTLKRITTTIIRLTRDLHLISNSIV